MMMARVFAFRFRWILINREKMMIKKIVLGVLALLLLVVIGFVAWGLTPLGPGDTTREIIEYTEGISIVDYDDAFYFCPYQPTETKGIIFYPGGRVDYRSYTPILYQLAQAGVPVVMMKMPLSLAVLAPNRADQVLQNPFFPCQNEVTEWYIGGHSLGGAMAAVYAGNNLELITGLILLASYPPDSSDLSATDLRVLSIFATKDGLTTKEDIDASKALLPTGTNVLAIVGGNHAQFGDYGTQGRDGEALIEAYEQWRLTSDMILWFLYSE
jgi:hypothetical protein